MRHAELLVLVLFLGGVGCASEPSSATSNQELYEQTLEQLRVLGETPEAEVLAETLNQVYERSHIASIDAGVTGLGDDCTAHALASQANTLIPLAEAIAQGSVARFDGAHIDVLHESFHQLVTYVQGCVD